MYKAVFAGEKDWNTVNRVYDEKIRERLKEKLYFFEVMVTNHNFKEYKAELESVEYIFSTWGMPAFQESEIREYFPSLKAVFYAAGSVQGFAKPFLSCGIKVFGAAASNAVPVAEFTAAQILLAGKGYFQSIMKFKKKGHREASEYCSNFPGNYGTKIGILGAGRIGQGVIELLKPCNLEILVYDPFLSPELASQLGVTQTGLKEIFSECQIVSNHLANNSETQGMLNYSLFSCMPDYAAFINTGRGAQVVEADLIQALKEKPGRTALLDVTFPEPPEEGNDFYSLDNVFLTPHIAGSMGKETARMGHCMYEEFIAFSEGRTMGNEVTLAMLKTMA